MGCSAAKNVTVEQMENGTDNNTNRGRETRSANASNKIDSSQLEDLENANVNNIQKGANGLAFEITFDENDNNDDNNTSKQLPKRILQLQETQSSPVNLQKIQEKLDEAETRRQQILQQRIQSAKLKSRPRTQETLRSITPENREETSAPNPLTVTPSHTSASPEPL
ncbi:uncharacterized protein LOC143191910 [Rhynchophorus ferrugineus]|uniref:Uncharacterized protein n=1 Tax=Rhynchophorus ferrugineus TaxID=354439 RepID=A0A834J3R5_RHYFE|nr:hypothetical protein GWI33_000057 [Rhynchophorus ferrugineus]